jgi:glycosyltransferase involved in cell wall biosynthesis
MSKPKILILENSTAVTGALKSVLRSSLLLRDVYDFVFIIPSGSKAAALIVEQGFLCKELPMKEIRENIFSLIFYFPMLLFNTFRLKRFLEREKVNLIVNNDFYNMLPPAYRFFGGRVPYVCYVRFLPSKFPRPLVSFWTQAHERYASKIIAVSNAVLRELPKQNNVVVIGNELPQNEMVEYNESDSTLILYPGNYIRGKGQEYALQSFARISKNYPQWRLRFVGGDMGLEKNRLFKESLIKQSAELGLQDRVEWFDFTADMITQYAQASIVVNFSESESFSLTVLEGMYYGKAVLATDCGGPAEIIDDQITGILVPVKNIDAMTEALAKLIADNTFRKVTAFNAYVRIRDKFNSQKITDQLVNVYKSAMNKNPNF